MADGRRAGAPVARVDRFDGRRAFAELRREVALGPRPAGSATARALAQRLRLALPDGRFEPLPGGLRNVSGRLAGSRPALLIAAHYDTKDLPGFVGANDGAAGTAMLLELARALVRARPPGGQEIRFVLFDGEESPRGSPPGAFLRDGVRGSRAYLAAHRGEIAALVLLDFVANRNVTLPREAGSDPRLWARLRAAARRVGVAAAFPDRTRDEIYDDHTAFARAGIPSIDLIDFDYPPFHTRRDRIDQVSARSLDAVGEAVLELVRRGPLP